MRFKSFFALALCAVPSTLWAQTVAGPQAAAELPAALASVVAPAPQTNFITIPRDTPVNLMAVNEVSTAKAVAGTRFKLRVNEAIIINGKVVVPVGTAAFGEVLTAQDSGGLGKAGNMTSKLLHITLGDVEIPLEGDKSAKGTGAGSAGVAVIFAGVAGLFHRGNNAKIKAGELLSGFVSEDVTLDLDAKPIKRVASETTKTAQ
jgi:hypothetical protein